MPVEEVSESGASYRVIQWYTGDIAKRQVRYIGARPDVVLVGAVAYHEEKEGLDVGELAGIDALGVRISRDADAALALDADCVLFNGLVWEPELVARILRSGKNVLTTRGGWYPRHEAEYQSLSEAAIEGGATLIGTGNMPGLVNDAIPLFAGGYTREVTSIETWESSSPVLYGTSAVTEQLGIGKPEAAMADPAKAVVVPIYHEYFRQSAHLVAERFGLSLEDFRLTDWKVGLAPSDVYLDALDYTIEEGAVAGFEAGFTGFVSGVPWYRHTVQHVWTYDLGDGWRSSAEEPDWVVAIKGDPSLRVQFETTNGPDPWRCISMLELVANRMVNLIPAVCAAAPGCQTAFDQPMQCGPGSVKPIHAVHSGQASSGGLT